MDRQFLQALQSPQRQSQQKKPPARNKYLPYLPDYTIDLDRTLAPFRNRSICIDRSSTRSTTPVTALSQAPQVHHLLSRASFGLSYSELQAYLSMPMEEIVSRLFAQKHPEPPGEWINEPFDIDEYLSWTLEEQLAFLELNAIRMNELRVWWLENMISSPVNLLEKMTLFWHGHFTTDLESAALAQFLYKQNHTLRTHALGNFRDMLLEIYKDPGMLLYLDGISNVVGAPNENFARELLELFTMGLGNYTEDDIKETARAFTGWQLDTINLTSFLDPILHDYGNKTIFGETSNFDGDEIIDLILAQPATAEHICRKLYQNFVSREVNEHTVKQLAILFRKNDYEIQPVLESIFLSNYFYGANSVASLIKSPVDLSISNARMLMSTEVNGYFLLAVHILLDHELMNPPNVAGWPGQRDWITPNTYITRNTLSEIFVDEAVTYDPVTGDPYIRFDPLAYAESFGIETPVELANAMADHLLRMPLEPEVLDALIPALLGGADPNDWSLQYEGVDQLIIDFLVQLVQRPEFHLT